MEDKPKVWLNGEIIPWEDAQVPILSHGFSRGSAVFEVFGTHMVPGGVAAFRMDAHLKRLERTVGFLGMELGFSIPEIIKAVSEITAINKSQRGVVKLMAYWGEEAIIDLVLQSKLDVVIFTIPHSEELGLDGVKPLSACLSKWKKLHPETIPVQAKACANYLNGYLVRKDANDRGFDLGLNVGTDGFLAEGSIESVFIVKDGILKTPPLGRILASVTRDSILAAARRSDIEVCEATLVKEDLYTADEMFTCHTGTMVTPIFRFEEKEMPAPGPVTARVSEMMAKITNSEDSRFKDWFQMLYKSR
jgi:branched-chain amino acid aminotransferase